MSHAAGSLSHSWSHRSNTRRSLVFGALGIVPSLVGWIVIFTTVPPGLQEFGLNDDAPYSAGLFGVLTGKGLCYFGWSAVPQLAQWIWTAPFTLFLGRSFVATRLATIVLSSLGTLAFFDLLRRERAVSDVEAAVAAGSFSLNPPLFFMCSGTFLTDVPSLSFSLIALSLFARGLRTGSGFAQIAGVGAAILAVSNRQNALVVPCVMAFMLYRRGILKTREYRLLFAPAVPLAVGLLVSAWFASRPDVVRFVPQAPSIDHLVTVHAAMGMYLGLFALPLVVLVASKHDIRGIGWCTGLSVCGAVSWVLFLRYFRGRTLLEGGLFPYVGNMLTPFGSFGTDVVLGTRTVVMSESLRIVVTALGCVGAGWLLLED